MSKTVKGRVQAVSPKPKKDWYGICIDDEWYNGSGDLQQNLKEAEVELELSDNEEHFTRIQEINVLEEANEDGGQSRDKSDSGMGSGSSNTGSNSSSQPNPKRANIMATAATKKAADIVAEHHTVKEGEFEEKVSTVATGLNNVMNKLYEENMQ